MIADLGFGAIYLTHAGRNNTHLGLPDLGFMDLTQVVDRRIAIRSVENSKPICRTGGHCAVNYLLRWPPDASCWRQRSRISSGSDGDPLGYIELEQKSPDFLDTGTEFVNPNFAAMAAAAGIKGIRIEDSAEVDEKPAGGLAYPSLVLVDAVVNRMEPAMPPRISDEMAKGFTIDMLKAVLNGCGDEIIGLVQSNLRRRLPLAGDSRPRPGVIDLYR